MNYFIINYFIINYILLYMSNTKLVYKMKKYKTKLQSNPNNKIYQQKYTYYIEQIGGGSEILSMALRVALCARHAAITTAEMNAPRLKALSNEQLIEGAANKLKNIAAEMQQKFRSEIRGNVIKGDMNIPLPNEEYKNLVLQYVQKPSCEISGININSNDSNSTVATTIINNIDKIATLADKASEKITSLVNTNLTPESLTILRNVYASLDH